MGHYRIFRLNHQRTIPLVVHGLKPGQRSLFCSFNKQNFAKEARVSQFSGNAIIVHFELPKSLNPNSAFGDANLNWANWLGKHSLAESICAANYKLCQTIGIKRTRTRTFYHTIHSRHFMS
ncbi:unnamed protein product [Camellia sinensis]